MPILAPTPQRLVTASTSPVPGLMASLPPLPPLPPFTRSLAAMSTAVRASRPLPALPTARALPPPPLPPRRVAPRPVTASSRPLPTLPTARPDSADSFRTASPGPDCHFNHTIPGHEIYHAIPLSPMETLLIHSPRPTYLKTEYKFEFPEEPRFAQPAQPAQRRVAYAAIRNPCCADIDMNTPPRLDARFPNLAAAIAACNRR